VLVAKAAENITSRENFLSGQSPHGVVTGVIFPPSRLKPRTAAKGQAV